MWRMTQADSPINTLTLSDLQAEFQEALRGLLRESRAIDPLSVYMLKRLDEEGGLPMAKRVLTERGQQTGLMRLWREERLEISVEALVLRPEYRMLFSADELQEARKRLSVLGYKDE
jgi:hypothetical protein